MYECIHSEKNYLSKLIRDDKFFIKLIKAFSDATRFPDNSSRGKDEYYYINKMITFLEILEIRQINCCIDKSRTHR